MIVRALIVVGALVAWFSTAQAGEPSPKVTAAEASLINCTISSVRLEDKLKAAEARIAALEEALAKPEASEEPKVK